MDRSTDPGFFALLTGSHRRLVGAPLAPEGAGPDWLYEAAPFAVLAHDTADDPCFVYANRAAQACFEYSWTEFLVTPSRLSAQAPERAERARLLEAVARDGVVWQLVDDHGTIRGQAATFRVPT